MDKTVDKYLQQEYSTYTMKKQKQHITKEQWDELSDKEKKYWYTWLGYLVATNEDTPSYVGKPNIGQMIEFLGDNFMRLGSGNYWDLDVGFSVGKYDLDKQSFKEEKLCDALWEAVKYKLK